MPRYSNKAANPRNLREMWYAVVSRLKQVDSEFQANHVADPNAHHPQQQPLYGFDNTGTQAHTDVMPEGPVNENEVLAWDQSQGKWRKQYRMNWRNIWVAGETYYPNDVVRDGVWTMVANTQTTDRAAVLPYGDQVQIYDPTPAPTVGYTARQVIFGVRLQPVESVFLEGYRIYTEPGGKYEIVLINQPLSARQATFINAFTATGAGWREFPLSPRPIPAGEGIEILVIAQQPDPAPITVQADYNYSTPPFFSIPAAGEAVQANGTPANIQFSTTDANGGDQSAMLLNLKAGDTVTSGTTGVLWTVQGVADNTVDGYVTLTVAPAVQATDGLKTFTFNETVEQPVTILEDPNYWPGSPFAGTVSGMFVEDAGIEDVTNNTNAYGVDVTYQKADISPDWDLLAYSGA